MVFLMPLGYIFCIGNCILSIFLVKLGGVGRPIMTLDVATQIRLAKLFKAEEMIYLASVMFPKLAVLSLYVRLFMDPVRRFSYITGAFVMATFAGGFLTWAFACRPFAFNWNKTIQGGHCINTNMSYAYFSVPNLVSDVAIILLPLHPLWKLQVPRSTKIGLIFTFVLGGFGMITAIIRFVRFLQSDILSDASYEAASTMKWTITEPSMYQIAATLPTLRPILTKTLSSLSNLSLLSKFSNLSRMQKSDDKSKGTAETDDRDHFVKLDDYHYMKNSSDGKDAKKNYSGVLKTTDVRISSQTNTDGEEHELTQHAH